MSAYAALYRHVVYPLYHRAIGHGALDAIAELRANETLSRDRMLRLEARKRVELLRHAGQHVPYWREQLAETGMTAEDAADPARFAGLPVTEKAIIRERLDDLVSRELSGNRLDPNSTSGSTGQPLKFFTDLRSKARRKASTVRLRSWLSVRQGEPVAHIWGSALDQARARAWRGRVHSALTREIFMSAYQLTDEDMRRYATVLRKQRVVLVVGYPSVLEEFAGFCASHGLSFPDLRAVITSAETLYPSQRTAIESGLGVAVFNRYGSREMGDMAQERPGTDGLVVSSDRAYLEIVREDGSPCSYGETGELLVTDLDNYGMPLIRYRIGDRATWSQAVAGPFPVLADVAGRSLDVVHTPGGGRVGGTFWTIVLREKPGLAKFQVVQTRLGGVCVRYVPEDGVAPDFDSIVRRVRETCGRDFRVDFEAVSEIRPGAGGKYRLVVSDLKASADGS